MPLLVVLVLLLVAAPAAAAPVFTAPAEIETVRLHDVVVAPSGKATLIATEPQGLSARSRLPGGVLGPRVALAADDRWNALPAAVDGAGAITVAWVEIIGQPLPMEDNGTFRVRAQTIAPDGSVGAPVTLAEVNGGGIAVEAAAGPSGDAIVAWCPRNHDGPGAVQASRHGPGEPFAAPDDIATASCQGIAAAVAADGTSYVAWDGTDALAIRRLARGAGPHPAAVVLDEDGFQPDLAVAADGKVVAGWTDLAEGDAIAATLGADLSDTGDRASLGDGSSVQVVPAAAVFQQGTNVVLNVRGSGWSPAGNQVLGEGNSARVVAVEGRLAVAFRAAGGIEVREDGAAFLVATGDTVPRMGIDGAGNLTVAWRQEPGTARYALGDNDGGPELDPVAIPASASAGLPVALSVTPRDWLPVSGVRWTFGDGTTATGASVSHTFAKAGSYTVAATATDAVGQATTRSAPVTVEAGEVILSARPTGLTRRRVRGNADEGTASVQVSVRRLARKGCRNARSCKPRYRAAKGTTEWSRKLRRLRPGRYVVHARALDAAGVVAGPRTRETFRLRKR